ncbi:methyltransferase domain-containing protein [bacterium]|nr:methyltransferase domain-containing protein [bacterium]
MTRLDPSSRNVLNRRHVEHFPGDALFARLARAVCAAECLPRKELYEAWETARRVRRRLRGGPVLEAAAGHGLLAAILVLLDDTTPRARCVDIVQPPSHAPLLAALTGVWPRLAGRIEYVVGRLEDEPVAGPDTLIASVHACGTLTDAVLDKALAHRCPVAVLPCCHDLAACDDGGLAGWLDGPLAVDATRAARLRAAGYRVWTSRIPAEITPKNRLLVGWPDSATA